MTPCPICNEPLEAPELLSAKFQFPDPLEHVYRKMRRAFYFSEDGKSTVNFNHRRGRAKVK